MPRVSDGLLTPPDDVDVIRWFNLDMDGVKPALVCLGPCLARLQVHPLPFHQAQDLVSLRLKGHWGYSLPEGQEILGTGGKAATQREMGLAKA